MAAPTLSGGASGWSMRQAVLATGIERRAAHAVLETGLVPHPPFFGDSDLLSLKTLAVIMRADRGSLWATRDLSNMQVRLKEADRAARHVWQHGTLAAYLVVTGSAARLAEGDEELRLILSGTPEPVVLLPLSVWATELRSRDAVSQAGGEYR